MPSQFSALLVLLACGVILSACGGTSAPTSVTAPATTGRPAGGAPAPTTPAAPGSVTAQRILDLTNAARARGGSCGTATFAPAAPLTYNAKLEAAAQGHASDMAARDYFDHVNAAGVNLSGRVGAAGYSPRLVAENIAAGQTAAEEVVVGWLNSPGHCRNIMDPALRELGVGYATSRTAKYGTYWVQDFGTPH